MVVHLVAVVGMIAGLKDIGLHSKIAPAFVLPDSPLQARGLNPAVKRGLLRRGESYTERRQTKPDRIGLVHLRFRIFPLSLSYGLAASGCRLRKLLL